MPDHPGRFLRKVLKENGLRQPDLAKALGCCLRTVNRMVNEGGISFEMAHKLAEVFDQDKEFWIKLQKDYDESIGEEKRRRTYRNQDPAEVPEKDFQRACKVIEDLSNLLKHNEGGNRDIYWFKAGSVLTAGLQVQKLLKIDPK